MRLICLTVLVFMSFTRLGFAQMTSSECSSLQTYFQSLHGATAAPVASMDAGGGVIHFDPVESAFGPRHQHSTDRYDFHRGIDVDGSQGDDIFAVTDGVFYEYREFSAGGHTVILRHDFDSTKTINGRSYDHYYTYYMHLFDDAGDGVAGTDDLVSGWTAYKDDPNAATVINAGDHIGEMGNSGSSGGDPYADHLHMELRVGATTSLIYQLENVGTTTQHGFDPHVNPLLFFEPNTFGDPGYDPTLQQVGGYLDGVTIEYSTDDENPLLNRIEVEIVEVGTDIVQDTHVLDYNLREGFDATTLEALDDPDDDFPYMDPQTFGDTAIAFTTEIEVPGIWLNGYLDGNYRLDVTATDIWGNETLLSTEPIPEPKWTGVLMGCACLMLVGGRRREV